MVLPIRAGALSEGGAKEDAMHAVKLGLTSDRPTPPDFYRRDTEPCPPPAFGELELPPVLPETEPVLPEDEEPESERPCGDCRGTGESELAYERATRIDFFPAEYYRCSECDGTGKVSR